jgi:GTP-binding protein EngB required for normal cell division
MLSHTFTKLAVLEKIKSTLRTVDYDFSVPGVVVVGAQSSGKSSVLETMTGLAFPRSEGMCTRVPCIVSVSKGNPGETSSVTVASDSSYTVDVHSFDASDASAFEKAIRELTEKKAPYGRIADDPIYVKYLREEGPTYTLTDLPGITCISKVQSDVEQQTIALTNSYMANRNALLLCVLPATDDFHNSKALKLAKTADPHGERTIGVVTKIDNLPPGSDILRRMAAEGEGAVHLNHGFFAVRNRTQTEVESALPLADVENLENTLFKTDEVLKQLPSSQCGMRCLLDKVCNEQSAAIDTYIPSLHIQIRKVLFEQQKRLAALPTSIDTPEQKTAYISQRFVEVASDMRRAAEADVTVCGQKEKSTKLAARVHEELRDGLATRIFKEMPEFLGDIIKQSLREGTNESRGYDLSNFMQSSAFRSHFIAAVDPMLFTSAADTAQNVLERVISCFKTVVEHRIKDTNVALMLCDEFDTEVSKRLTAILTVLARLARSEVRSLYTNNHYFSQTIAKFKKIVGENQHHWKLKKQFPDHEDGDIPNDFMISVAYDFTKESNDDASLREMQITLFAYGKVVRKRFSDSAALIIRDELLVDLIEQLPVFLNARIEALAARLVEEKHVAAERNNVRRNVEGLTQALSELKSVL